MTLLRVTDRGLFCEAGGFHIDPWCAVDRAVVTHAHGDHVAWGCGAYLTAAPGSAVLRARLDATARIRGAAYGEAVDVGGVRVSLHPAGHILGSAQVRVEYAGEVWVVSGDYKTEPDPTCAAFEPVRCHTFVTECTFGLPVYRWPPTGSVFDEIHAWWRANQDAGKTTLLFGYALGKAQRLIAGLDPAVGPILTHGAVERMTSVYREVGVPLPPTTHVASSERAAWKRAVVVAPPSAVGSAWARRFGAQSTAFASGWMAVRGARRRSGVDRGFVLSDHVDWAHLLEAIADTGAERVWATHGHTAVLERWLRERGVDALAVETRYEGERDDAAAEAEAAPPPP
ncbi:MAG TPA: ligase-associated DNA damage response exonuclease [Gemmatimonadales bacterium]|nr:ligase-associated DNA damage response exonuclease [Gemmatimonadales bacterium]